MKNLLIFSIGFCLIISVTTTAQVLNDSGQHGRLTLQTKKSNTLNTLEGSPYENENFQAGQVAMEGNETINVFLRYDVLNDEIEIRPTQGTADIYVLEDKKNTEYTIGDNRFLYKNVNHNGSLIEGYFIEYYGGQNVSLLKRLSATTTEPVKAQTGYQKDKPARIVIHESYFLLLQDGTVKEVKLKEKDFKKALPNSQAAITYFSENKVKDLKDFVAMLEWYDKQS